MAPPPSPEERLISAIPHRPTYPAPETPRRVDTGVVGTPPTHKHLRIKSNPFSLDSERTVIKTILSRMARLKTSLLNFLSPQQADAIKAAVDETSDLIVVLPIRGGKTIVYQIPCLLEPSKAHIVVSPLDALLQLTGRKCLSRRLITCWRG